MTEGNKLKDIIPHVYAHYSTTNGIFVASALIYDAKNEKRTQYTKHILPWKSNFIPWCAANLKTLRKYLTKYINEKEMGEWIHHISGFFTDGIRAKWQNISCRKLKTFVPWRFFLEGTEPHHAYFPVQCLFKYVFPTQHGKSYPEGLFVSLLITGDLLWNLCVNKVIKSRANETQVRSPFESSPLITMRNGGIIPILSSIERETLKWLINLASCKT